MKIKHLTPNQVKALHSLNCSINFHKSEIENIERLSKSFMRAFEFHISVTKSTKILFFKKRNIVKVGSSPMPYDNTESFDQVLTALKNYHSEMIQYYNNEINDVYENPQYYE